MTTIVASGKRTYVDPSALLKLYLHEAESGAISKWRARVRGALPLTLHGRLEITNGICLAAFRKAISTEAMTDALLSFAEDLHEARYIEIDMLWRAAVRRAVDIARSHTSRFGCRTLDVLHVATALELGMRDFVTFDARQRRLARDVGLRTVTPRS